MKRFMKWWKTHGQLLGFVLLIIFILVTTLHPSLQRLGRETNWYSLTWLVTFTTGAVWYRWQMNVHGWRLPEDLKNSH